MPGMFFAGQFDLLKRWLMCQRITLAPMLIIIIGGLIHVPLALLLVRVPKWEIIGLAVASDISYFLFFVCLLIYCNYSEKVCQAIRPIDKEAFRGWGAQLKTSLPIVIIVTAMFWSSNIMIFMAGNLGVTSIAAMTVPSTFQNIVLVTMMGV